jgi:tetratricopeptide (TPR) repeat protein
VLAYFMAAFSKEHSALMPAVLAAETILLRGRILASTRSLWLSWISFCAIGLLIILRAKGIFGTPYEAMASSLFEQQGIVASTPMLHLLSILTQAGLFFKYLLLWLLPNPAWMAVDMRVPLVPSLSAWQGWLGAAGFALYGFIGVRLLLRGGIKGLIGLALLYPWLQFVLEFTSVRVQEPFVLYRSYLWLPGMLLIIPILLNNSLGKRTWMVMGVILILLASAATNRLWVFADNYRLWNDAARLLTNEHEAGADRIYFNLGQAEAASGKREEAIADFKRALAISPQYAPVHFELGWLYAVSGRYEEAMVEFDASITNDPSYANAYYGKGLLMKMRSENTQATELLIKSCELKNAMACLLVKGYVEH